MRTGFAPVSLEPKRHVLRSTITDRAAGGQGPHGTMTQSSLEAESMKKERRPDFGTLYRRHGPQVRQALCRLGVRPSSIDDAVQDVFLVLHRRFDDYDRSRSLLNWLWGIARGVASTYRRSDRRRFALMHSVERKAVVRIGSPAGAVESLEALDRFLSRLDDAKCEVFVLSDVYGYTGPEIAGRLGVNVNTVYARLRAARAAWRAVEQSEGVAKARAWWMVWRWPGEAFPAMWMSAVAAVLTFATAPSEVASSPEHGLSAGPGASHSRHVVREHATVEASQEDLGPVVDVMSVAQPPDGEVSDGPIEILEEESTAPPTRGRASRDRRRRGPSARESIPRSLPTPAAKEVSEASPDVARPLLLPPGMAVRGVVRPGAPQVVEVRGNVADGLDARSRQRP